MIVEGYCVHKSGMKCGEGEEMARSTISYLWRDANAPQGFRTGVSLHSHTNQSTETLDFLANLGNQFSVLRPFLSRMERRSEAVYGIRINYAAAYWTPPMPRRHGLHHRPRHHQRAHAAQDHPQRARDSRLSGVERSLRSAEFPPRRAQP